jgi:filamentous hemagglutinin family protein
MASRILARLAPPALLSALILSTQAASPASQLPGGVVTAGTATFSVQGNTLTVTNTSGAVINWQDFSIGSGASARFVQPSSSSVVLNRVVSQSPSTINGSLMSNGRVFLVNPNGALFGAGSVINTAGFTVSTGNATDSQFLANQGANGTGTFLNIDSPWVVGSGNVAVTSSGLSAPDGLGSTPGPMTITTNGPINVGNLIPSGSPIVTGSVVALTPGSVTLTAGSSIIITRSGASTGGSTITNNTANVADRPRSSRSALRSVASAVRSRSPPMAAVTLLAESRWAPHP